MPTSPSCIRILEHRANRKGDLFGRMVTDVFQSIGYSEFRLNIHKSGREIDIQGTHRTEKRLLVAECKAVDVPIGGDDINKFVGALDVERKKKPTVEFAGYFLSISGWTETGKEQEEEAGNDRVVLLDSTKILEQLIIGRIVVPEQQAIETASRFAGSRQIQFSNISSCELLAHEMGWIWAVSLSTKKQPHTIVLVHADGELLSMLLAKKVLASEKATAGTLWRLRCINPAVRQDSGTDEARVRAAYVAYLSQECGEIQLEGLPADQEVGTRHFELESIFVPLHISPLLPATVESPIDTPSNFRGQSRRRRRRVRQHSEEPQRLNIGDVLGKERRIAVLGLPGGGKSTLLKRLAVAYTSKERRLAIQDGLPEIPWLPLLIRCRQLEGRARSPLFDTLSAISERAELGPNCAPFRQLLGSVLQSGEALLLIDGLDEIADEGDRVAFTSQLRTFLATYPSVGLVITSREAGFRIVGGALTTHCSHFRLADFDDDDIRTLTVSWHRQVVGDRPDVVGDAEKLASVISATDRVRRLAQNPLLLTTLLLVKRWVGQLPTRRSILYGKAVEVLLMTWNVAGHEPLDIDEALPQLEFVAFVMLQEKIQRISSRRLKELLILARAQMPEVLGYSKVSPSDFIARVELRSSLLVQSGHAVEYGTLYPVYEFRHLTFQEYLAACAIVNGHYPGHSDKENLMTVLSGHLMDHHWEEVILLVAVLAGRRVLPLAEALIATCRDYGMQSERNKFREGYPSGAQLLAECVADEIQVPPDVLTEAMRWIARTHVDGLTPGQNILRGKYGVIYRDVCVQELRSNTGHVFSVATAVSEIGLEDYGYFVEGASACASRAVDEIKSGDVSRAAIGCLALMHVAWASTPESSSELPVGMNPGDTRVPELLLQSSSDVYGLICSELMFLQFSAMWATCWMANAVDLRPPRAEVFQAVIGAWSKGQPEDVSYVAAWCIRSLPLVNRDSKPYGEATLDSVALVAAKLSDSESASGDLDTFAAADQMAALTIAYYLRSPFSDDELAKTLVRFLKADSVSQAALRLLEALGESGRQYLKDSGLETTRSKSVTEER